MTGFMELPWRGEGIQTRGLLFIGDPHLWSKRPGRRLDDNFTATVLGKIDEAITFANDRDLWPFFLGDLLHDDHDEDTRMLVGLARVLQKSRRRCVTLTGNHDKSEVLHLNERNPLLLLGVAGLIDIIDSPGFWGKIMLTDGSGRHHYVAVGGTPYGHTIEKNVPGSDQTGAQTTIWLTHHDLAFGPAYPGSQPLHEIGGVDLAINGHIHGTFQPRRCGKTAWYNPGNITRLSVDMAGHVPRIWSWTAFDNPGMAAANGDSVPLVDGHALACVSGARVFDFEGRHATATEAGGLTGGSAFVGLLGEQTRERRADDGAYALETIERMLQEKPIEAGAEAIVRNLFVRAGSGIFT